MPDGSAHAEKGQRMSKLTPMGSLPYPEASDVADVPAHVQSLAEAIDGRTVLRYPDAATRDARITSPVGGMVVWLDNPGKLYHRVGSQWAPVTPPSVHKAVAGGGTTVSTTYVETLSTSADPMSVTFTAPPTGVVIVTVNAVMYNSTAGGSAWMSAVVRQGTTVVSGGADSRAAVSSGTGRCAPALSFQLTGLTAGGAYTATGCYRSSATANTVTFDNRCLRVDPVC